jgi:hypothetical protein
MLHQCVECLAQEERDRNVPANWEELVDKCEMIAEARMEQWDNHPSDVGVDKYGVTETWETNSYGHDYTDERDYSLEEYIDNFGDLVEDEEEEEPTLTIGDHEIYIIQDGEKYRWTGWNTATDLGYDNDKTFATEEEAKADAVNRVNEILQSGKPT